METVMNENIAFKYHCTDFKNISLHDAVVSGISYDENHIDFYLENGLTLVKTGAQTLNALIRVKVTPDDINVYLSTKQISIFLHTVKYKTKSISLEQLSFFLTNSSKIEIIECFEGILNSSIWRCVSFMPQKNTFDYFEIQFYPTAKIEYDIFYN